MKAEDERGLSQKVQAAMDRARAATDAIEPPPAFAERVVAATRGRPSGLDGGHPHPQAPGWTQLDAVARRAVPVAMLAAAAALALAWYAESPSDGSTALDDIEEVP
jgi:hypothetical protein